jgi:hypothetical protein
MSRLLDSDPAIGGSLFNLMQCISALRIEVNTGMRHSRGSILKHSQQTFGVTSRTKKGALEELEELYHDFTGRKYGTK